MIITDEDPLPIYGYFLVGVLILILILNSILGQYLAGWRAPKTGDATARPNIAAAMSQTTLRGDISLSSMYPNNRKQAMSVISRWDWPPAAEHNERNPFRHVDEYKPEDKIDNTLHKMIETHHRAMLEGSGDDNDRGTADKRFTVATRSSFYSDEGTLGNGTITGEEKGVTGGQDGNNGTGGYGGIDSNPDGKSRYAVLRDWNFF